jgi:hypothetical protein
MKPNQKNNQIKEKISNNSFKNILINKWVIVQFNKKRKNFLFNIIITIVFLKILLSQTLQHQHLKEIGINIKIFFSLMIYYKIFNRIS